MVADSQIDNGSYINISIDCDEIYQFNTLSNVHFQTFIYFSYILIMIISLIGNGLVCYLVISSSRMRSVTNFFIVNLSAGDMLMTLLCVPFSFVNVLILMYWPFGEIMCRVVSYWQGVSVFVSAYTLVAISIDRYIAIMSPLKPRMSKSWAKVLIGGIWLFACATALPILIVSKTFVPDDHLYKSCDRYVCQEDWDTEEEKFYYTIVLMILQYGVPFFVLVYTYTRIAIVVWGKKTPGEAENVRDQRMAQRKRKMIKMMVTVVVVFTICWLPFNVIQFFLDYEEVRNWPGLPYLWFSFHWLAMSHACYNPFIYAFMNNRFKIGFIGIRAPQHSMPASAVPAEEAEVENRTNKPLHGNVHLQVLFTTTHRVLSKFRCARHLLSKYNEKALSGLTGMECAEYSLQRRHTTTTYISVKNNKITGDLFNQVEK